MIITLLVGVIIGAILMFVAVRNGYVKEHKKTKLPDDLEIGRS